MADARILIVEDEGIEAIDLQLRLTKLGYAAPDIASTGEEAVLKAEETLPDLILMDIMLHGEMDGVTAAGKIHSRFDIPIIFLTAYADEATLQRAKITEPYGYLVKPFKERDLHISIDMALYKHTMEKKVKESEKWFATTLGSIGDAVIATDKNGLITFMNPVAEGLTGWKRDVIANKKLTEVFNIINMETRKPVENPIARVLREGVTIGLANHTILIAKDGTERPIDDSAAPIRDDRGNIIGAVLVFRDVTERKRAEDAVRKTRDELAAANKELEAFAYSVSHDLRAPLRVIEGFSNAIVEEEADRLSDKGKDYFRRVLAATQKMGQLIDALLSLSRITQGELRRLRTDLTGIALIIIDELRKNDPERNVEYVIPRDLRAAGDPDLLRVVLTNLLQNSWKFTSKQEDAKIEFGVTKKEGKDTYFIRDNGAGFDMTYANKLFMAFQRLHSADEFPGIGIGLATVQRIIHRHGGKIWAESAPDKGATFYFTLE